MPIIFLTLLGLASTRSGLQEEAKPGFPQVSGSKGGLVRDLLTIYLKCLYG